MVGRGLFHRLTANERILLRPVLALFSPEFPSFLAPRPTLALKVVRLPSSLCRCGNRKATGIGHLLRFAATLTMRARKKVMITGRHYDLRLIVFEKGPTGGRIPGRDGGKGGGEK